jgi:agmatinase
MDADPKTDSEGARLPLETGPDSSIPQRSFFRAPFCTDLSGLDAQVALLGVPYDLGTPTIGLRLGPGAIRDATGVYSYDRPGVDGKVPGGYYDIDADRQRLAGVTMADCGDVAIVPGDVERNLWRITRTVRTIAAPGSLLVSIGGEQSINVPILRGLDHHPSIDFVHFDAHLDYYDHVQGIRELSAGTIRRVATLPHVRSITQIGIHHGGPRRESFDASRARGNRVITVDRFREIGAAAAVDQVPESDALYISFDMDVMDPAGCPGSGSPEPGGLTYWEMRAALRALARRGRVVGMDLVDLAPPLDHPTGITARTGARLIIDLLTAVFD